MHRISGQICVHIITVTVSITSIMVKLLMTSTLFVIVNIKHLTVSVHFQPVLLLFFCAEWPFVGFFHCAVWLLGNVKGILLPDEFSGKIKKRGFWFNLTKTWAVPSSHIPALFNPVSVAIFALKVFLSDFFFHADYGWEWLWLRWTRKISASWRNEEILSLSGAFLGQQTAKIDHSTDSLSF